MNLSAWIAVVLPRAYSPIAQSVEQPAVNRFVVGSSPTRGVSGLKSNPRICRCWFSLAHAVTDEVRAGDFEVIEQRSHIVGEVLVSEISFDFGRAPVDLHFVCKH